MEKNYYQILGLQEDASLDEIKAAYKKYVVKFHPDKHNNDEFFKERFQEIQEAYEYLINESVVSPEIDITTYDESEEDYEEEDEEFCWDAPNYTYDAINFQCSHSEISVGDTIVFSWNVPYSCSVSIKLDNGNMQSLFEELPQQGSKHIKINKFSEGVKATLIVSNENSIKTKVLTIPVLQGSLTIIEKIIRFISSTIALWVIGYALCQIFNWDIEEIGLPLLIVSAIIVLVVNAINPNQEWL